MPSLRAGRRGEEKAGGGQKEVNHFLAHHDLSNRTGSSIKDKQVWGAGEQISVPKPQET